MKCFRLMAAFAAATMMTAGAAELSVLMIGNSFSQSVLTFLPKLVQEDGNKLYLVNAYIGGCTLKRHVENIQKAPLQPDFKPYVVNLRITGAPVPKTFRANLPEIIKLRKWDIVTIQQGSHESWDYQYYQPFADQLIEFVRRNAPGAEIRVQQTWSYRSDAPRLAKWKFDNREMFRRVEAAYGKLAAKHGLAIIPVGLAVSCYREKTPVAFRPVPKSELKRFVYPAKPSNAGDVVGSARWRNAAKNGGKVLSLDTGHLNLAGTYLQALVWNASLFGTAPGKVTWQPSELGDDDAALCRKSAAEALRRQVQPVKK